MNLDAIRKKLDKTKTIEERRVIVEELRDRRSRLWELYRSLFNVMIIVFSGQGLASLCAVYSYFAKLSTILSIMLAIVQGLAIPLTICIVVLSRTSKQIRELDNLLLDPSMLPVGEKFLIIILILGIAFTIIGTIFGLAALGIIHL